MSNYQLCSACGQKCRRTLNICPTCYPAVKAAKTCGDSVQHCAYPTNGMPCAVGKCKNTSKTGGAA